MLSGEAADTNFVVFGFPELGISIRIKSVATSCNATIFTL
jgi:hypothetical protein